MNYRRRSSKIDSWLRGLLYALIGVFVGVALIAATVALLVWNEAGVLQAQRTLDAVSVGDAAALIAAGSVGHSDIVTWLARAGGLLGLIGGFALVGGPLSAFFNIVPGMGAMVRFGTGMFATALGLGVLAITLALVWLLYRPWLSVVILVGGAALVVATLYIGVKIADGRYRSEPLPQSPDQIT